MVQVSDGKSRPRPARLVLTMDAVTVQREVLVPPPVRDKSVPHARERMVQITRQKVGGLGLSIKGGSEHKLPILISKIYKDQAADQTGQLFVVNGEYITACKHDDAVNILRNAGDIVVLTVKHYRAATPFLQKQAEGASDTDSSTGDEHPSPHVRGTLDDNCNSEKIETNGGWQSGWSEGECEEGSARTSRASSLTSAADPLHPAHEGTREWVDIVSVPLMMGYVTRYVSGTDKLRPGAFEMKLFNRHLPRGERIEYMGWVQEGEVRGGQPWQNYTPKFLMLKGTDVLLYDTPPMSITELTKCPESLKIYQTMFRTVKESETVDWRPHCFLLQSSSPGPSPPGPRYFSTETRHELLRLEAAWTADVVDAVIRLGKKTFTVVHLGRAAGLTLDWASGFSLAEGSAGAPPVWAYRYLPLTYRSARHSTTVAA
ncbi:unnamed protein product [Leptidea sinapis]|uniref:PDZ domain-containing protein n=1 Tax=Leptidea sinapis TaxID=189913 RepID=A0A5E4QDW0_9NEOP|nr:unnamed protein product [Leptidea sinapis]